MPRYRVFCIGCCCYHRWCVRVEKSKRPLCLRQRETWACFLPRQLKCILLLLRFRHGALCCYLLRPCRDRKKKKRSQINANFPFLNFAIMKCQTLLEVSVGTESQVANEATNWAWRYTVVLICQWLGANMAVLNSCISHIIPSVDDSGQSCVSDFWPAVCWYSEVYNSAAAALLMNVD